VNNVASVLDRVMQPPPGYNPNISNLPDPGANAVNIKPMMGGGGGVNTDKTTVTILGEPYRIRKSVSAPLEDEEVRLLEAFHVEEKDIPSDILFSFFHALTEYNCEKEQGVLLNPKCEPVRAILRSVLMKKALNEIDLIRKDEKLGPLMNLLNEDILRRRNKFNLAAEVANMGPLVKLLNEDTLRRRNKFSLAIEVAASAPPGESVLDEILGGIVRERYKISTGGNGPIGNTY